MNATTYITAGVLLIMLGVFGMYHIREFPGLAFFALMGLFAGIATIGKVMGKL
mgnify:CR=1 FL=1